MQGWGPRCSARPAFRCPRPFATCLDSFRPPRRRAVLREPRASGGQVALHHRAGEDLQAQPAHNGRRHRSRQGRDAQAAGRRALRRLRAAASAASRGQLRLGGLGRRIRLGPGLRRSWVSLQQKGRLGSQLGRLLGRDGPVNME